MSSQLSDEQIPDEMPWRDEGFLWTAYHERGLTPRAIAYDLGVEKSRVTVHMDRLGVLKPWTNEDYLRHLYVEQGLSAEEIAAREECDCSPTTVRKYLNEYDLIETDVSYGRLDALYQIVERSGIHRNSTSCDWGQYEPPLA